MPEIKHNFTGGKMNKDLDERLIPNGEYTDAMNIQVSTSEGSDVGTVQNILGNRKMGSTPVDKAVDGGVVVCSIADEKNDKLYYFVWTPDADYILEYSRGASTPIPVFIDKNKDTLKFREDIIITGVNIIDDMLFWTDNNTEPKKINITRCKEGTPNITTHTKLINDSQGLTNVDIEEKHITVIRKAPRKPLDMVVNSSRDPEKTYTGVITVSSAEGVDNSFTKPAGMYNFSNLSTEDGDNTFEIEITEAIKEGVIIDGSTTPSFGDINENDGLTGWHVNPINYPNNNPPDAYNNIKVGTKIVFKPFDEDGSPPGLPVTDYVIKGIIEDKWVGPPNDLYNTSSTKIRVKAISIDGFPPVPTDGDTTLRYVVDLWDEEEKLFEFKFPRFSYRYKFEDGEYSPFAPFTQVAFLPGSFDYHPRKGYNLGMTNRAVNIELSKIITPQTPKDVVAVDILFKDETSPSIYVVDTLRPDEYAATGTLNKWNSMLGDWRNGIGPLPYTIKREQIQSVVPSNQLLRPWDNVPRKALAQDVTGNRIVYANYLQNYDLKTESQEKYVPNFAVSFNHAYLNVNPTYLYENTTNFPNVTPRVIASGAAKSIKSLREYQLGVVFTDKYGRETPVISNTSALVNLEKQDADKANSLKVMLNDFASRPEGLTHLKFYVKETSGEYYNMAMDRFYDAADGNVWLAFPSSDRDKIDIDTFLILKKGSDQDTLVSAAARYKVIAIENEAPDYIKTSRLLAASKTHGIGSDLFTNVGLELPLIGVRDFKMSYAPFASSPARNLDKTEVNEVLYVDFEKAGQFSDRYKITSIAHDEVLDSDGNVVNPAGAMYSVQLEETLKDDINFISNDTTGVAPSSIPFGARVNIYKYKVENKPQFDGRFFVKIYEDETFKSNIGESFIEGLDYRIVSKKKVYLMKRYSTHKRIHWGDKSDGGTDRMLTQQSDILKTSAETSFLTANKPAYAGGGINPYYELTSTSGGDNAYRYFKGLIGPGAADEKGKSSARQNAGYYQIDEFASMVTYFRRMRCGESPVTTDGNLNFAEYQSGLTGSGAVAFKDTNHRDVRPLIPGSSGSFDVKYQGEFWKEHPDWYLEYGRGDSSGYTARWQGRRGSDDFLQGDPIPGIEWLAEKETLEVDRPKDTEVWFIDAGPAKAHRNGSTSDSLDFNYLSGSEPTIGSQTNFSTIFSEQVDATGYGNRKTNPEGHQDQPGITDYGSRWDMQLSYGGIKSSGTGSIIENHFNIGDWHTMPGASQNAHYVGSDAAQFLIQMDVGTTFRWKEDPTGTVYTLSSDISPRHLLRHSARRVDTAAVEPGIQVPGGTIPSGYSHGTWSGAGTSMAEALSFNYTTGLRCRKITPALAWNPVYGGIIPGGYEIPLIATDINGGTSNTGAPSCEGSNMADELILYTDSITGTDINSQEDASIHVGMALHKYTKTVGSENTVDDRLGGVNSGAKFLVVRHILEPNSTDNSDDCFKLILGGWHQPLTQDDHNDFLGTANKKPLIGSNLIFVQVGMNGYSHNSEFNINTIGRIHNGSIGAVGAVGYTLEIVKSIEPEKVLSENPAIWETEPKEIKDLDVYYEASPTVPVTIDASNVHDAVPVGSVIQRLSGGKYFLAIDYFTGGGIIVVDADGSTPYSGYSQLNAGNSVIVTRPDGLIFTTKVTNRTAILVPDISGTNQRYSIITLEEDLYTKEFTIPYHNCYSFGNGVESNRIRDNFNLPFITNGVRVSTTLEEEYKEERRKYGLIYSGIYNSTGGVNNLNQFVQAEKITKDINPIYGSIQKLHSRDTDLVTLCEDKVLRILANKDAVFNADGNTNLTATQNVLGQTMPFSGEYGISKNPESFASEAYRAYFTDRVRGTVMRLSKDGLTSISSHGMKDWFKDNLKLNNTAFGSYDDKKEEYNLTLSNRLIRKVSVIANNKGPGTPWTATASFITNSIDIFNFYSQNDPIYANGIPAGTTVVSKQNLGNNEWEITLSNIPDETLLGDFFGGGSLDRPTGFFPMILLGAPTFNHTISFKENVKGWVSFKSFLPENALSMGNDYYTFKNGNLWRHHSEHVSTDRNTFYNPEDSPSGNNYTNSSVEVVLNDLPSSIKDFQTLNYEGSQSKIHKFASNAIGDGTLVLQYQPTTTYTDQSYYNLADKNGWYVDGIYTDKEEGYIKEFLEKEGKWYNNINRTIDKSLEKADTGDFTFQGIGIVEIAGCTNPSADNYNPNATVDDGSCDYGAGPIDDFTGGFDTGVGAVAGCTFPLAFNYDPSATVDDGSCIVYGCADKFATNWWVDENPSTPLPANVTLIDDGSCIYVSNNPDAGCTDPTADNYDATATVDDGSCVYGAADNSSGGPAGAAPPPDSGDGGGEPSPRLGNPDDEEETTSIITPTRRGGTTY